MDKGRIPLTITVEPWFYDHFWGDKIVMPAVEAMLVLGAQVQRIYPETDIRRMHDATFAKFLEIPDDCAALSALLAMERTADGQVQAQLLSRTKGKAISRIKEHCRVFFSPLKDNGQDSSAPLPFMPDPPTHASTEIEVDHLYRHLVPFGPTYQTLQKTLYLFEHEAWGRLRAADLPLAPGDAGRNFLGSPFPLDGAMHAACVLGQQSVDFVPFPVGFTRRIVMRPTRPGASYVTRVRQTAYIDEELIFDLVIWDKAGQLYETVTGLRMRNVGRALKKD